MTKPDEAHRSELNDNTKLHLHITYQLFHR